MLGGTETAMDGDTEIGVPEFWPKFNTAVARANIKGAWDQVPQLALMLAKKNYGLVW